MRQKPWPLILIALLHFFSPIGNSLMNALRFNISFIEIWTLRFEQLNPTLLFIYTIVPMAAGVFIYICKRWSFFAYLGCLAIIFGASLYGFLTQVGLYSFAFFMLFLLVDFLLVTYFMVPAVRSVYMDPRLRWWDTSPRYSFNTEASIQGFGKGFITNISLGGLFLKTEAALQDNANLNFEWNWRDQSYKVVGTIVYHKMMDTHGYGVKFVETPESKKSMKSLTKILNNEKFIIINRPDEPTQSFITWLKIVLTSGKGLFPTK